MKTRFISIMNMGSRWGLAGAATAVALPLAAAVLPEERIDALFHSYRGGGMEISGPSYSVRANAGNQTSLSARYYVDAISSASIDVITSASPYSERREEYSVGIDFLRDKSSMNLSVTESDENDYHANTVGFGVSQDLFGDMLTLTMGYARGQNDVGKRNDPTFNKEMDQQRFQLGLTQIISKDMLVNLNYEMITDKGFLNNPYRQVRFSDGSWALEEYPNTRSSHATGITALYYLPFRASLRGEYRLFTDTWGIGANNFLISFTQPNRNDRWLYELRFRTYNQTRADFYSDLFSAPQTHMARDKELSTFNSQSFGLTLTYDLTHLHSSWRFIDKGSASLAFDHTRYNYENFRNALLTGPYALGEEPLYHFNSNTLQFYISLWY